MKYIITLVLFLSCAVASFGQGPFPVKQSLGSPTTLVKVNGAIKDSLTGILATWLDTTAANVHPYIKSYPAATIYTTSDEKFWVRNSLATAWIETGKNLANANLIQTDATRTFDLNFGTLNFLGNGKYVIGANDYPVSSAMNYKLKVRHDNYAQGGLFVGDSTNGSNALNFVSINLNDTVTTANATTRKNLAFLSVRNWKPQSGAYLNSFYGANAMRGIYDVTDSFRVTSKGGDFAFGAQALLQFRKSSAYTGRSVVSTAADGSAIETIPAFLADLQISGSTSSSNSTRLRGWWSPITAYTLVPTNDTIDNVIGVFSRSIISGHAYKFVDFLAWGSAPGSADSTYAFVAPFANQRNFFNGTLKVGGLSIDDPNGRFKPVDPSAQVDIESITAGVLLPRMTTTQQNTIASPASGLLIYNTDSLKHCYYTGSAWVCYGSGSGGGGATPTFQETLIAGSLLTQNNVVDVAGNEFGWANTNNFYIDGDASFSGIKLFTIDGAAGNAILGRTGINFSASDSLREFGLGLSNDTTSFKIRTINPISGALSYANWGNSGGGGGSTSISALTAAAGTNTINNAALEQEWQWNTLAGTEGLHLSSTSTAAASDAQILFRSSLSGANGTAGQFTSAIAGYNTHTGSTSENVGVYGSASGGTYNYSGWFNEQVSIGGASIPAGAVSRPLMVRQLSNVFSEGAVFYPNANYGTSLEIGYGGIVASADITISVIGGDAIFNSAQSAFGNVFDPTAKVHIAAGSATAGTAPLKLVTGPLLTTPEVGGIEYNNGFYITNNAINRGAVPVCIAASSALVSNSGTSATALFTYTTKASTLSATDEMLYGTIKGSFGDNAGTETLTLTFAGTNIFNQSGLAGNDRPWDMTYEIVRTGASTATAFVTFLSALEILKTNTFLTGLTFTNTNILVLTGTSSNATTDAIRKENIRVNWVPAAAN